MRKLKFLWILVLLFGLLGCMKENEEQGKWKFKIYYINNAETKVGNYEFFTDYESTSEQIYALLEQMQTIPEKLEYKVPFAMGFGLINYKIDEGCVYLNVDSGYKKLTTTTEILVRAALVRTLTQVEGIEYVTISMEGEPIEDSLGNLVGMMSADQFIDNAGSAIINEERVKLNLYFSNEAGNRLRKESRTIEYNSNIALEKLVMEELIKGPQMARNYPILNPDIRILSISVQDGICYVNLDETFLTQIYNVSSGVTIYGIVNSLAEINGINQVQISINGKTDVMYQEKYNLTTIFERDLDLLSSS